MDDAVISLTQVWLLSFTGTLLFEYIFLHELQRVIKVEKKQKCFHLQVHCGCSSSLGDRLGKLSLLWAGFTGLLCLHLSSCVSVFTSHVFVQFDSLVWFVFPTKMLAFIPATVQQQAGSSDVRELRQGRRLNSFSSWNSAERRCLI